MYVCVRACVHVRVCVCMCVQHRQQQTVLSLSYYCLEFKIPGFNHINQQQTTCQMPIRYYFNPKYVTWIIYSQYAKPSNVSYLETPHQRLICEEFDRYVGLPPPNQSLTIIFNTIHI